MEKNSVPDYNLYEYSIVRYVPRIDRGEFINIGVIMMCKRRRWLRCRLKINKSRILAFAPDADLKRLEQQIEIFNSKDVPFPGLPVEETYRWLTAVKSAVIQTSPSHPGLATSSLEDTLDSLFRDLIE